MNFFSSLIFGPVTHRQTDGKCMYQCVKRLMNVVFIGKGKCLHGLKNIVEGTKLTTVLI